MTPLESLLAHYKTKAAIARALGFKNSMTVQQWFNRGRIPPKHAKSIEKATDGALKAEQLCPDVFGETQSKITAAA